MAKPGKHLAVPCTVCGELYRQYREDQLYCSRKCASRAWRKKWHIPNMIICPICCEPFDARALKRRKYCSSECFREAEWRKRKARASGKTKGWSKGKKYVPRQICLTCGKEFYAPPVLRRRGGGKYCSRGCYHRVLASHPERFPQMRTRRGKGGKREDLGGLFLRSAWEANYARYLNWLIEIGEIAAWEYEPDTFEFEPIKRGTRFYTPDFKITESDGSIEYHEVKGWMDPRSRTQLNRMAKYHPDVKLVLIDKEPYYAIARQVKNFILHWETG